MDCRGDLSGMSVDHAVRDLSGPDLWTWWCASGEMGDGLSEDMGDGCCQNGRLFEDMGDGLRDRSAVIVSG